MIDLHTHTNESDGSYSPGQLIREAVESGLEALAITDHDTLAGYAAAEPRARAAGLELICGIELSTKLRGRSVHLLGYFTEGGGPAKGFRDWLREMQESRRDRNLRLAERLRSMGMDIRIEEVQAKGRGMTGRPHFAAVMVEKGYVSDTRQAFDEYLDESAQAYVPRLEPKFHEGIERIRNGGGIAVLPHPVRGLASPVEELLPGMCEAGLQGIEAYHSDHTAEETGRFLHLAEKFGLLATGGSDFHGDLKPEVRLGTGHNGNLRVPYAVLERLKEAGRRLTPQPLGGQSR